MRKAGAATRGFAAEWKITAKSVIKAGKRIGIAIGAIGVAVTKLAFDFEDQMGAVRTLVLDMADKDFAKLEKGVRTLSVQFGRSTSQMADGLFNLISSGQDASKAVGTLEQVAPLVVAGNADMGDSVKLVSTLVNAYGGNWERAGEIVDKVFEANRVGVTTVSEMAGSLGSAANIASTLGISMDELFGSFASITKGAPNTSAAVTQLRSLMVALASAGDEQNAVFQQAGFDSAEAAVKEIGLAKATKILTDATGGSVGKMTKLLGRVEAVNGALNVAGDNFERTTEFIDGMTTAAGSSEKALKSAQERGLEQFRQAWQQFLDVGRTVGLEILPDVADGIKQLGEVTKNVKPEIVSLARDLLDLTGAAARFLATLAKIVKFDPSKAVARLEGFPDATQQELDQKSAELDKQRQDLFAARRAKADEEKAAQDRRRKAAAGISEATTVPTQSGGAPALPGPIGGISFDLKSGTVGGASQDITEAPAVTAAKSAVASITGFLTDKLGPPKASAQQLGEAVSGLGKALLDGVGASRLLEAATEAKASADKKAAQQKRLELMARLLTGKGTAEDQSFLKQQIAARRQELQQQSIMQRFSQLVEQAAGGLQNLGRGIGKLNPQVARLTDNVSGASGAVGQTKGPGGGVDTGKIFEAFGTLVRFADSFDNRVASIFNDIQVLTQKLSFAEGFSERQKTIDQIRTLQETLQRMFAVPAPAFVSRSIGDFAGVIGFDPGLQSQSGGSASGGLSVAVNVQEMDGRNLLDTINRELQRSGHQRFV